MTVLLPGNLDVRWDLVLVNLLGALLLGLLVGRLGRATSQRGREVRLLLGTGVLGGFTTYSALAFAAVELAGDDRPGAALLLPVASVVLGLMACGIGLLLGARTAPGRSRSR